MNTIEVKEITKLGGCRCFKKKEKKEFVIYFSKLLGYKREQRVKMEIKIIYRVFTRNAINNIYVMQLELTIHIYIPDMLFNLYLNPECLTHLKKCH